MMIQVLTMYFCYKYDTKYRLIDLDFNGSHLEEKMKLILMIWYHRVKIVLEQATE